MRNRLASGALGMVVAGVSLAACASGPVIRKTVDSGSDFCKELRSFSVQTQALTDAANQPLATLQQQLPPVSAALDQLVKDAPAADTVNGHVVKTDLQTEANVYHEVVAALQAASPNDPNAVANALAKVDAKRGGALTDATGRLDSYAHTVCLVVVSTTSTSTSTSTTTSVPGSTTTAPAGATTTTTPPVGPVAPTTTA
jgi:hypothetical protein